MKTVSRRMRGFSALEMIAVLAAMAVISGIAVFSYDQSHSRAVALAGAMNDYANALRMARMDMSCYPTRLDVLFDRSKAVAANAFCGLDLSSQWRQRYAQPAPVDASGNVLLSSIGAQVRLTIASSQDAAGTHWQIVASQVPNEVVTRTLEVCNGAGQTTGRCSGATGNGGSGTLSLEFDLT
jgi:prepilin-type N-terminal cleavage/methylation domain-containing protein